VSVDRVFPVISLQDAVIRLVVATVLGSLIGLEREIGEQSAGLRTHALVSLAASLFMLVSIYSLGDLKSTLGISFNPTQVAAQVVSGIGFLGAGAILLRREVVRGLTTAAALWFATSVGLACGAGMYAISLVATLLALFLLLVIKPIERRLFPERFQQIVRVKLKDTEGISDVLSRISTEAQQRQVRIFDMAVRQRSGGDMLLIRWRASSQVAVSQVLDIMRSLPDVTSVEATLSAT
jgi:putative Mg2+ transporter-C (MgtC) family protein